MNFGTGGPQYKLPGELEMGLQAYRFLETSYRGLKACEEISTDT
jgi:hypothetical protein